MSGSDWMWAIFQFMSRIDRLALSTFLADRVDIPLVATLNISVTYIYTHVLY